MDMFDDGRNALLQARHGIGSSGTPFTIEEVEADHIESAHAELFARCEHSAIGHVPAGSMREREYRSIRMRPRRFEHCGGTFAADLDPPLLPCHAGTSGFRKPP